MSSSATSRPPPKVRGPPPSAKKRKLYTPGTACRTVSLGFRRQRIIFSQQTTTQHTGPMPSAPSTSSPLSSIPNVIFYDVLFPFLSLTDFKFLISCSNYLTRSFEIPLNDLSFSKFACLNHDTFLKTFVLDRTSPSGDYIDPLNEFKNVHGKHCCVRGFPWRKKNHVKAVQAC